VRPRAAGGLPHRRAGQPQPGDQGPRAGRSAGPEVSALPAPGAPGRGRDVRHHRRGRRAPASPVRLVQPGPRVAAPGGGGPVGAGDQADPVPLRRGLADRRVADPGRAQRQGRDRRGGAACALRRGSQPALRRPDAGGRGAGGLWRGGLQDARQDDAGRAARGPPPAPLRPPGDGQLPRRERARVHRLRPAYRQRAADRGRPPDLPATVRPVATAGPAPHAAVALHPAQRDPAADRARDRTRARRPARPHRGQDERAQRADRHPCALCGLPGGCVDRPGRARRVHPARRGARGQREHPRALDRRPLPRAQPDLLVRQRRGPRAVLRERRLAGAQPVAPGGGLLPDPGPGPRRPGARGRPRQLPGRQRECLGAAARWRLPPAPARRRAAALGTGLAACAVRRVSDHSRMRGTLPGTATPLQDGELLAAVDLGSNSFHMVVAQYLLGQLRVVDRLRETVRLGEGLDARGGLSRDARARAFECLARFGQRIRDVPAHRVRALATNTVRRLAAPQAFLMPAESALGHAIEVVSGREEARLVYLGVAHAQPSAPGKQRLVIDIGGGSTEFIIGSGLDPIERESLQAGSIATTRRFFSDGKLDRRRWDDALTEVLAEFQQFANNYRALGWDDAIGSSGTNKAIGAICAQMGLTKGAITAGALPKVRDAMLAAGRIEAIDLPGLGADRRPIIAGGLLVLEAAFQALGLERLMTSKAAMREGVLYDMVGRGGADDPRDAAVDALMQRYGIDRAQALRVEATALRLFDQLAGAWAMDQDDRLLLARAARLHELGLTIAHSQYHLHGAY